MGKISKVFGMLVLVCFFMSANGVSARPPYENSDPSVQLREHKLMLNFLNREQMNYSLKVYSPKNRLIHSEDLGDALTIGKILDFTDSERIMYRIKISREGDVIFDKRIRLGEDL